MNTRAIDILLEIMADTEMTTRRRIEAAEALLGFVAPADAVARAREYLIEVADNRDESIGDRLDALQASRKAEAAKITPQTVHMTRRDEAERKEAWRKYEILQTQDAADKGHTPTAAARVVRRFTQPRLLATAWIGVAADHPISRGQQGQGARLSGANKQHSEQTKNRLINA